MSTPITTLLFQIQSVLFAGSCLLLGGSLLGLYRKSRILSGEPGAFFSGNGEKSSAEDPPDHERRRARRMASNTLLELMSPSGEFVANSARMRDISVKGACFDSPFPMKRGKRLEARLHSSNEGLLRISARIIWLKLQNNRVIYGVEFDSVNPMHS